VIFVALPLTEKLYAFFEPKIGRDYVKKGDDENA
jgi:hypothetical protein